jgi:alkanesulfonate monooxygenase SsuD/methylene tetrahydromethanopterin reductase-like flavin-dependent oxidoreductase (luciferase family)
MDRLPRCNLEFGIFAPFSLRVGRTEHEAFREWLDLACIADDLGIDCFWLAEFHFRPHTPISAPLVVGSALAQRTKHIKVGLGVQLLPLANPLRLAEECATLDHMTEGRLVYGVGRSSFLDGYAGYGIDYEQSRSMFFEALEVIRRAWGDAPFSFDGEYFKYSNVNVVPKPFQRPHPPVRIACESRATFGMMGNLGFPILIRHQMEISELQTLLGEYEAERHAAGFDGPNYVTLQTTLYLADTKERAVQEPRASTMHERAVARIYQRGREADDEASVRLNREPPYEELIARRIYATPEEAVDRLQEYKETLGITGVSLTMNPGGQMPKEQIVNSMRLLMEKVAPRV